MRWKWPRHFGNSAQGRTAEKASVAQVDHVELARFWGDEVKPTLCALIVQQYTRTSDAVRSGRRLATVARHRKPKSEFDRNYTQMLFAVGAEEGRLGHWRQNPPLTPMQAVAKDGAG